MTRSPLALLLILLAAAVPPLLSACAPVIVAGAASAALVATDRRSAGAQLDDTTIETKLLTTVAGRYGDTVHFNVTSYNGMVLLTGEVPDAAVRADIYALARGTERVRGVHDELVIGPTTDLSARTNDSYITSKVKSRFVESDKFSTTQVKVVTERGVVYLMGLVSRVEADDAARIASTTSGVARVVKLFEITG
ncbi:MAG: BON domain-containing protein [Betaproteobacteria bacterium]|jgi:osmotically-inducible protein OsmY|nr:BON domain-containing protein [Betaproteobacteria bacterium]